MDYETDQYARPSERLAAVEAENKELRERLAQLEGDSRQERYSRELEVLGRTHKLNREQELERLTSMTDEAAKGHLECIRDNYERLPTGIDDFDIHRPDGLAPGGKAFDPTQELDEAGAETVARYCAEDGLEWEVAREKYCREQIEAQAS